MSRHRRRSGPFFWIGTFFIGLFSTERGKRRIGVEMAELRCRISDLEYVNRSLADQLLDARLQGNCFLCALAAQEAAAGQRDTEETPADTDSTVTTSLPVVQPTNAAGECDNSELTETETDAMSLK